MSGETDLSVSYVFASRSSYDRAARSTPPGPNCGIQNRLRFGSSPTNIPVLAAAGPATRRPSKRVTRRMRGRMRMVSTATGRFPARRLACLAECSPDVAQLSHLRGDELVGPQPRRVGVDRRRDDDL